MELRSPVRVRPLELAQQMVAALDGEIKRGLRRSFAAENLLQFVLYRIADPGPGFKMEGLAHAAISYPDNPIEHMQVRETKGLRPGGFGLLMVKAKVDELIYNEIGNEAVLIKYLDSPPTQKL